MPLRRFLVEASWMLLIPLIDSIYLLLNHGREHVYTLVTVLDERIPFLPYFIIPYIAWYGVLFATLVWFLRHDLRLYRSSIVAIIFGLVICFIVFSFFQTTVPRPEIRSDDIFAKLIQLLYSIDNPYNAFPSIHVLTSFIVFLGCLQIQNVSPKISLSIQATIILVILSTVFLKQHTFLDVLGGLILGGSLYKVIRKFESAFYIKASKNKALTNKALINKALINKALTRNQNKNEPILELIQANSE